MFNIRFGCFRRMPAVSSHLRCKWQYCPAERLVIPWVMVRGVGFTLQYSCNVISTGKESRQSFYQLDGCILKHVSNHPYLGIELSQSLTLSFHIANNIVSSACQNIGFLWRNLKRCPRDVKTLAYYALVRYRLVAQSGNRIRWVRSTGLKGSSATPQDSCAASIGADPG